MVYMHMGARAGRQRAGTDLLLGRISVCVGGGGGGGLGALGATVLMQEA